MVSALVFIVTHRIIPMVSHDISRSGSHDFTKMLYYIVSQPWENPKLEPKLIMTLAYGWDPNIIIYSLWIEWLLMETNNNGYFQIEAPWYFIGLR